jgi:hypothetical protein
MNSTPSRQSKNMEGQAAKESKSLTPKKKIPHRTTRPNTKLLTDISDSPAPATSVEPRAATAVKEAAFMRLAEKGGSQRSLCIMEIKP